MVLEKEELALATKVKSAQYSAMDFAYFIVNYCTNNDIAINELKLQRVLYYVQLAFIYYLNKDAFYDDFVASQYGPIVQEVADEYSCYSSTKICLCYEETEIFTKAEETIILAVLSNCLEKSGWELINLSKNSDGPWYKTYQNGLGYKKVISKEMVREYALK